MTARIGRAKQGRPAFTLFEAVLALGLGSIILAGVYWALNVHVDSAQSGRDATQQAAAARQLFIRISADIINQLGPIRPWEDENLSSAGSQGSGSANPASPASGTPATATKTTSTTTTATGQKTTSTTTGGNKTGATPTTSTPTTSTPTDSSTPPSDVSDTPPFNLGVLGSNDYIRLSASLFPREAAR